MRVTRGLLLGALSVTLASCSYKLNNQDVVKDPQSAARLGEIRVSDLSARSQSATGLTAEEFAYAWNYPKYPQDYTINLNNRDPNNTTYLSDRQQVYQNSVKILQQPTALAPLGSYAGPWIEGEESKLLPVSNPNIPLGQAILQVMGNEITAEMKPTAAESPFQAYLKLQKLGTDSSGALRSITVTLPAPNPDKLDPTTHKPMLEDAAYTIQLDKEALWSLTMTLYRDLEPAWTDKVAVQSAPNTVKDGAGVFGNCNMCHGADGWGLGHSGLKLQPPPANFHEPRRLFNRSNAKLELVLKNGIYGSAMPPWGDKLGDKEIAVVISYLRHFTYSTDAPVMSTPPTFKN